LLQLLLCRPTVLRKLTSLQLFDGRKVSDADVAVYGENGGALTLAMVLQAGAAGPRTASEWWRVALGSAQLARGATRQR
jgi:hypothetical protein